MSRSTGPAVWLPAALLGLALATATLPVGGLSPSSVDADDDGVRDGIESDVCGEQRNRELLALTENTGRCLSPTDYQPERSLVLQLPQDINTGPDADGDGFPTTVAIDLVRFEIDRSSMEARREDPGTETVAVDSGRRGDDSVPSDPALSQFCLLEGVTMRSQGGDSDGDGFPERIVLGFGTMCVDPRDDSVVFDPSSSASSSRIDPDDGDPNEPGGPEVGTGPFASDLRVGRDRDDDTILTDLSTEFTNLTYDRRDPADWRATTHWDSTDLDPDDRDRREPVPVLREDADEDRVFDRAEDWICSSLVDDHLLPSRRAGLGTECQLLDYRPPSAYRAVSDDPFRGS